MIDPTLGLRLSLSAIDEEYKRLGEELKGTIECLDRKQTFVTMLSCVEQLRQHSQRISHIAAAEVGRLTDRLNRHATVE